MSAHVIEGKRDVSAHRMSSKSRRPAVLLGILVTISVTANTLITVAAGSAP